ncbi:MAG: uroporphyrinogen decarboxylase family protein [Acidobacteriota bacterium]|nr:MAG: uroporphyrinogen decarboxylase family protein [Acidobacteriota bacterium]
MNGFQRIMAALSGRNPDRVPVMLHNFMLAAREYGVSQQQFRSSPRTIARAMIQAVETYELDGVLVDIDTATLAGAVGVPVDFPEDEPARAIIGCLDSLEEVPDLGEPQIRGDLRIETWLEAVRLLVDHFKDEVLIRGNCDQAPFSLASMMRTPSLWMMDLLDDRFREELEQLLQYCTRAVIQFVELMDQAGAHVLSNGDSPAGPDMISPQMYREFALPYEKQVVEAAHRLGKPYVLHICGRTDPILDSMVETGADGFEFDQRTDSREAGRVLADRATFFGNIDPSGILRFGSVREVQSATRELIRQFKSNPRFVLNAGCAIPPDTPVENIRAMVECATRSRLH